MSKPARKKVQSPFARNLKAILAERGLSQKAAAEVANVTPATLNDWLAGSNPSDHLAEPGRKNWSSLTFWGLAAS